MRNPLSSVRTRLSDPTGRHDEKAGTLWPTPIRWRDEDGVYYGHNGEAWLYRALPTDPIVWEDPSTRLARGQSLDGLLHEIGQLSRDSVLGITGTSDEREIHVLSVTWDEIGSPPQELTPDLTEFQEACLDFLLPRKVLALGVKLKSGTAQPFSKQSLLDQLTKTGEKALGEAVPDRKQWAADLERVSHIMLRYGARILDRTERGQIESWFNNGQGPEVLVKVTKDAIIVDDNDRIELAVVRGFNNHIMESPGSQWILDAVSHRTGPSAISIRGVLQTATAARRRVRTGLRRRRAQMEEERLTGDIERVEDTRTYQQAQQVEAFIALNQEPLIARCSIIMAARRNSEVIETYIDELRNLHGIDVTPLVMRQLDALDECLPCSSKRVNPFLQDISIAMLAYCGLQGWSNLGDGKGVFMGLTDPDYTPCYLDLLAAPDQDKPPSFAIFGDPGSGKTFLCQLIATQAVLAGQQVIFINPKAGDSLSYFAKQPNINGSVVNITDLEGSGGFFDPFNYAEPDAAAEMLANFILSVLGGTGVRDAGWSGPQELDVISALRRGARGGARCAYEALAYIADPELRKQIDQQIEGSTLFSLAFGRTPRARQYSAEQGLTLIEFGRKLNFPPQGKSSSEYTRDERIALAAMRLVTRASLEILMTSGGGVLIVDEAWTFLSSSDGLAALQQIGREGRSLNILPIFATQRVNDLIKTGVDMESYITRVMVMELRDPEDAKTALRLAGLEATPERVRWLSTAGPQPATETTAFQPATGLHRDLRGRHAAIYVGPVPADVALAFTTNPTEKRLRDEEAARLSARSAGAPASTPPIEVPSPETNSTEPSFSQASPAPTNPPPDEAPTSLDDLFGS
jgi:hypothetical protein